MRALFRWNSMRSEILQFSDNHIPVSEKSKVPLTVSGALNGKKTKLPIILKKRIFLPRIKFLAYRISELYGLIPVFIQLSPPLVAIETF